MLLAAEGFFAYLSATLSNVLLNACGAAPFIQSRSLTIKQLWAVREIS